MKTHSSDFDLHQNIFRTNFRDKVTQTLGFDVSGALLRVISVN